MPHYLVRVMGRGLHTLVDGAPQCLGFYVNRVVRADSEAHARDLALERVREDVARRAGLGHSAPRLEVDSVRRLSWMSARWTTDSGFVFFPEDSTPPAH